MGQLKLGIGRLLELVHNGIMSDSESTVDISNRRLMLCGANGSVGQRVTVDKGSVDHKSVIHCQL